MRWLLLLALLLAACTGKVHPRTVPEDIAEAPHTFDALADTYAAMQGAVSDQRGWVELDRCDALLWASLRAAAGVAVDVDDAQDPDRPGRWLRRPLDRPECYAAGESASTISRDMLLGVFWWAWTARRGDVVEDLWAYGSVRDWFMGDGRLFGTDTWLNGNMVVLLARLCVRLNAVCSDAADGLALIPLRWDEDDVRGYQRHLEVLQILLSGELDSSISDAALQRLRKHDAEQPRNPLFAAARALYDGLPLAEVDARLGAWPSDRLPQSSDWCSSWRTEVEDGSSGALPCGDGRTHSGGEVLFIRRVLWGPQ